jgi:hypothetical protein
MNARNIATATTAVGALIAAGVAASVWPEFKQHATTAGITLLGLIALVGLVAPLILRQPDTTYRLAPTVQRPAEGRETVASGQHTGADR